MLLNLENLSGNGSNVWISWVTGCSPMIAVIFKDPKRNPNRATQWNPFESLEPSPKNGFIVFKTIRVVIEQDMLILEWKSNPTSDSYADSVLSTILRVDTAARGTQVVSQKSHMNHMIWYITYMYVGVEILQFINMGWQLQLPCLNFPALHIWFTSYHTVCWIWYAGCFISYKYDIRHINYISNIIITFIAHDDVLEDILNDKLKIGPAVSYGLVHFEGDENCKDRVLYSVIYRLYLADYIETIQKSIYRQYLHKHKPEICLIRSTMLSKWSFICTYINYPQS